MDKVRKLLNRLFSTDSECQIEWIYGALMYAWSVGDITELEYFKLRKEFGC